MTARNPYVFIVGAARSGTTLLQRMLDAPPMIAVVNETYWLPRKPKERDGLTPDGLVTPALIAKLLEAPKFARMELDRDFLSSLVARSGPISYPAFVSTLFDRFANDRGKPLGGDKT